MQLADLEGKRVLIVGAAREAGTVVRAMRRRNISATLTVVDEYVSGTFEGLPIVAVDDLTAMVDSADIVVRSPGVSIYKPALQKARESGKLTTATALWFAEHHTNVIAVTGTKGKSTTASLVAHVLNDLGRSATLAGNIGVSPLEYLDEPEPDHWVLELSSFQTSDLDASPDVGVLTSLSPEHLDWHGTPHRYFRDKLNLFAHNPGIVSVINDGDATVAAHADKIPNVQVHSISIEDGNFAQGGQRLFPTSTIQLVGRHNKVLVCLVLEVLIASGVDVVANADQIAASLATFAALPYRLFPVGEHNGVLYIDDSLATNPLATIAAVEAFADRPVTLLAGGYDRGISYDDLGAFIAGFKGQLQVVLMPTTGERIEDAINAHAGTLPLHHAANLSESVQLAAEITPKNGVVLMSPASASFVEFEDYAARGKAFARFVSELGD